MARTPEGESLALAIIEHAAAQRELDAATQGASRASKRKWQARDCLEALAKTKDDGLACDVVSAFIESGRAIDVSVMPRRLTNAVVE